MLHSTTHKTSSPRNVPSRPNARGKHEVEVQWLGEVIASEWGLHAVVSHQSTQVILAQVIKLGKGINKTRVAAVVSPGVGPSLQLTQLKQLSNSNLNSSSILNSNEIL